MMVTVPPLPIWLILIRISITGTGRGRIALVIENDIIRWRGALNTATVPLIQVQVHGALLLLLLLVVHLLLVGHIRTASDLVRRPGTRKPRRSSVGRRHATHRGCGRRH